ncbi:MAG: hypothetical protein QW478_01285 [Candidatus Micrarchaeaceae archaeon]
MEEEFNPSLFLSIKNVEFEILLKLDYDSILKFCQVSKDKSHYCRDLNFWATKAERDFNVPINVFKITFWEPKIRYLQLMTYYNKVGYGAEMFLEPYVFIELCIEQNKDYLIYNADLKLNNQSIYEEMLRYYVDRDDILKTEETLEKIEYLDLEFMNVRSLQMLQLLNRYDPEYEDLIKNPDIIKYANFELIKYLFNEYIDLGDQKYFLIEVLKRGDIEIFHFIAERLNIDKEFIISNLPLIYITANDEFIDYVLKYYNVNLDSMPNLHQDIVKFAAESKNLDFFVKIMLKYRDLDYKLLFNQTLINTNLDILKFIATKFTPDNDDILHLINFSYLRNDFPETVEYVLEKYNYNITFSDSLIRISNVKSVVEVLQILKKHKKHVEINLLPVFINAMYLKDEYFMREIVNYDPKYKWDLGAIKQMAKFIKNYKLTHLINILFK